MPKHYSIGNRSQRRAAKKSVKGYQGEKGKASLYVMKETGTPGEKMGYARKSYKPKMKVQKPTTSVGRKSLKRVKKGM